MASLSTCNLELVVWDGNLVKSLNWANFHDSVDCDRCKTTGYGEHAYGDISTLPQTSVVTCFHTKEDLLEIIHTLHSLVQRTPARLLREIVIVDDHSVNGKILLHLPCWDLLSSFIKQDIKKSDPLKLCLSNFIGPGGHAVSC